MSSFSVEQLIQFAKAHHQAGRLADAETIYRNILSRSSDHPDALSLLGVVAIQTGRFQLAAQSLRRAVSIAPDVARYQSNLGECLRLMGDLDGAILSLRAAVLLQPGLAVAHNNLGIALAENGSLDEAIGSYRKAIGLQPQYSEAYSNLGNALLACGDLDGASLACRSAVQFSPNRAENWNSLGVVSAERGEAAKALEAYRRAITIKPTYAEAHTNLGNALAAAGQEEEAATAFRGAVELAPHSVPAHWNLAVELLRQGDFRNGWKEHEWRLKAKSQFPVRSFPQPQWTGEDLNDKTILLHAEQGFGDTIQFVRYAPLVAARGGRVILECQPELYRLLKGLVRTEGLVARGDPLPPFDLQCPLLSLPLAFETTLETIPARKPYLSVAAEYVRAWATKMPSVTGTLNVGLCWAGSPTHSNDASRSIPLADLSPLAFDGVTFYSLQRRESGQQAPAIPRNLGSRDFGDQIVDFTDTAALILNLDLVISVDTAVAHLAGALGKPVWLLLPFAADWRWLLHREDSPWYPTLRLFRQRIRGNWKVVLQHVADELKKATLRASGPP